MYRTYPNLFLKEKNSDWIWVNPENHDSKMQLFPNHCRMSPKIHNKVCAKITCTSSSTMRIINECTSPNNTCAIQSPVLV